MHWLPTGSYWGLFNFWHSQFAQTDPNAAGPWWCCLAMWDLWPQRPKPTAVSCLSLLLDTGRKCIAHEFLLLTRQKNSFHLYFLVVFPRDCTTDFAFVFKHLLGTCSASSDHTPYAIICWGCTFSWLTVTLNFCVSGTRSSYTQDFIQHCVNSAVSWDRRIFSEQLEY